MRYHRNPGWQWEADLADTAAGLGVVLFVVIAAVAVTLIGILLTEVVRIFRERALQPTPVARFLWIALAGLAGVWLLAGLLATYVDPAPAAYLAAWGFLLFCIVVELCDLQAQRQPHYDASGLMAYPSVSLDGHMDESFDELVQEGVVLGEDVPW